jgi:hypothetical protein
MPLFSYLIILYCKRIRRSNLFTITKWTASFLFINIFFKLTSTLNFTIPYMIFFFRTFPPYFFILSRSKIFRFFIAIKWFMPLFSYSRICYCKIIFLYITSCAIFYFSVVFFETFSSTPYISVPYVIFPFRTFPPYFF